MEEENTPASEKRKRALGKKWVWWIVGIYIALNLFWGIFSFFFFFVSGSIEAAIEAIGRHIPVLNWYFESTPPRLAQQDTYIYENSDIGLKFSYPSSMPARKHDGVGGAFFVDSFMVGAFSLRVGLYSSTQTAEESLGETLEFWRSARDNFKVEEETEIEVDGILGKKIVVSYDYLRSDGSPIAFKYLFVTAAKDGKLYDLSYGNEPSRFNDYLQDVEKILQSSEIGYSLARKNNGVKLYQSAEYGFEFLVPETWYHCCSEPEENRVVGFASAMDFLKETRGDEIFGETGQTYQDLPEIAGDVVWQLRKSWQNFILKSQENLRIAGRPAIRLDYEFVSREEKFIGTKIIMMLGGTRYVLTYQALGDSRDPLVDNLVIPSFKIIESSLR